MTSVSPTTAEQDPDLPVRRALSAARRAEAIASATRAAWSFWQANNYY
ncbi:hypothetical protein ACWDSL_52400 [Streptomyces sp. NPDC000941]